MTKHVINCICHVFLRVCVQRPASRQGEGDLTELSGEAGLSPPADRLGGARKSMHLDLLFLSCLYQIFLNFIIIALNICYLTYKGYVMLYKILITFINLTILKTYINGRKYNEMPA